SGFPASSLRHSLSGFSPSAPAAESNCRMTSGSRFCKGSSSSPFQNPRSIVHPSLPPLYCSLPLHRLPRLPIVKYKTVLLHPSGSSPCRLTRPMSLHCTHPLRSVGFHRLHRCRVGGGALSCLGAGHRPPLKRGVQFSRAP